MRLNCRKVNPGHDLAFPSLNDVRLRRGHDARIRRGHDAKFLRSTRVVTPALVRAQASPVGRPHHKIHPVREIAAGLYV